MAANDNIIALRPGGPRDELREAKLSCECTAVIVEMALDACACTPLTAEHLENLKDTAAKTIEALQKLQAVLSACPVRGGGHA